jgi:multidrug efflux pump subunit AcrA (membrane-fusion protein)
VAARHREVIATSSEASNVMEQLIVRIRFGIVALAASVAAACSSAPADTVARADDVIAVKTITARLTDVERGFEVGGVVQARATASIAARLVAPVVDVRVAPGDRVRAGQVLVVLDGRDLEAHAEAASAAENGASDGAAAAQAEEQSAQASLTLARASYDRVVALHGKRSATAHELDQATASLKAAEGRVNAAAARVKEALSSIQRARASHQAAAATVSFLRLTAPFDGLVTEKLVEPGNMAAPGQPLLRVEDTRSFRVDVRVDESRAAALAPGTKVEVAFDDDAARSVDTGTISEVSRAVDADQRASLVKVALTDATNLRSGAFARVRFSGPLRRALIVPAEAVVTQGQVTSVFVVEKNTARLRLVRLRNREVLAGLVDGDVVIVSPPPGLTDGRPVTVGGGR